MDEARLRRGVGERAANTLFFAWTLLRAGLLPVRFPVGFAGPPLDARTIVVVPSTVRPSDAPLSYGRPRSVVPPGVRFEQTVATLESVRKRMPEAAIVLVESSPLAAAERASLEELADRLVDLSGDARARRLRDSRSKSAGEAYLLLAARELLARSPHELMLKLSARYVLTDGFRLDRFPRDRVGYVSEGTSRSTRLYSVPQPLGALYERRLRLSLRRASMPLGRPIEEVLFARLPAQPLDAVGVRGALGSTGGAIDE